MGWYCRQYSDKNTHVVPLDSTQLFIVFGLNGLTTSSDIFAYIYKQDVKSTTGYILNKGSQLLTADFSDISKIALTVPRTSISFIISPKNFSII